MSNVNFFQQTQQNNRNLPLSVGEFNVRLLKLQLKLCVLGDTIAPAESSIGKHVSTIASRQLTNNSDDSPIKLYCNSIKKSVISNSFPGSDKMSFSLDENTHTCLCEWTGKSP